LEKKKNWWELKKKTSYLQNKFLFFLLFEPFQSS
jgi:hypothetical protein